jgi:hypothetical protein
VGGGLVGGGAVFVAGAVEVTAAGTLALQALNRTNRMITSTGSVILLIIAISISCYRSVKPEGIIPHLGGFANCDRVLLAFLKKSPII